MAKWDYRLEPMNATRALPEWSALFERLGDEGWEYASVLTTAQGDAILFKRPRPIRIER